MTVFDPPTDSAARDGLTSAMTRSGQVERELTHDAARFRVLTGDRPTGPLHLGHYLGTLRNRVRLQDVGVEVFLVVADYQVITDRDSTAAIAGNVLELMADHLATGIDPAVTTIFAHSAVPALNQLVLPFLSLVTDAELRRNPTVKAELAATRSRGLSGLLLTYPVHQAADILFCGGNLVPVGPRPAAASGDHAAGGATLQRALRQRPGGVPGAGRFTQRSAPAARHGRGEDE